MNRREFLGVSAVAALGVTMPASALAETPGSFDFIFFTDTHIQPELDAAKGCEMCFARIRSVRADFAIQGGDHVFDALAVDRPRAQRVFDLYQHTEQALALPIHHAIGNHDIFGVLAKSGVNASDPWYGKRLFEERVGRSTFYSFDHKGYHFIVLDSIQPTPDRQWEARIDAAQLEWLKTDLHNLAPQMPVIVTVHVPLVSAAASYMAPPSPTPAYQTFRVVNAYEVLPLFAQHNVLGVLQGHMHINELVEWHGVPYITRGAVCGNWWHGVRWGTPEGFTVVSLRAGKMTMKYQTYGFKSVDPQNT